MSDSDCLELEHVIGHTGKYQQTYIHIRGHNVANAVGSVVVLANLNDPHDQHFLRQHTEEISALCVSESGEYLASGQVGSRTSRHAEASICVWDVARRELVWEHVGHTGCIRAISFSPDQRFLASIGDDRKLTIWEVETGRVLASLRADHSLTALAWGPVETRDTRRRSSTFYTVVYVEGSQIKTARIVFDVASQDYQLERPETCTQPSTGFGRGYSSLCVFNEDILAGTDAGELCVYSYGHRVYRKHIQVTTGAVTALCAHHIRGVPLVYVGGGRGSVVCVQGADQSWDIREATSLPNGGDVTSMSLSDRDAELLAATNEGTVFRLSTPDLVPQKLADNPIAPLNSVAFGRSSSEVFCTAAGRSISLWDLSEYRTRLNASAASDALCCRLLGSAIVSGHEDGTIQARSTTGDALWQVQGHRGPVHVLHGYTDFIASGGQDGSVRCWSVHTHELLSQFSEHKRPVSGVCIDCADDSLAHSCSSDHTLATYDLRRERKCGTHITRDDAFTAIAQRSDMDSENELITGTATGALAVWDRDYPDPIAAWAERSRINCIAVSSSGRLMALALDSGEIVLYDLSRLESPPPGATRVDPPRRIARALGHSAPVTGVAWSPDERQLVSVGDDCAICIWNYYG